MKYVIMSNRTDKNWNRPWNPEEILENADNWSLAGDAALLNTLKDFADNLLTKTGAISDRLDILLNNLDKAGVTLDLAKNEFQSLRNTQFIESRVYEDDETLDSKEEKKVSEKPISVEEEDKKIVDFIKSGITILDDYYDIVEVSVSDSEEESEGRSYIFQPKDLYEHRPLPPIIGTDDWKKWQLDEAANESESDGEPDIYSSGDSEDNLPKNLLKGSETSSELDFSNHISGNRPIANSSFNGSVPQADLASSSEGSENQGSLRIKTPISSKSFAEELAAKLGNVVNEQEDISSKINRKPIHPVKSNTFAGNLFSDEPPPLDNPDHSHTEKNTRSQLFAGGQGLFDDIEDDEPFWGQKTAKPEKEQDNVGNEDKKVDVLPPSLQHPGLSTSSQVSKGLFDSDGSSDEGIFSTLKEPIAKQPFLQPNKPVVPLFDDEPPKIEENSPEQPIKKKPPGGVSIFGSSDILGNQKISDILKNQNRPNITQMENGEPVKETKDTVDISKVEETHVQNQWKHLFDDSDNKLAQEKSEILKIKKPSLFDDEEDIFSTKNKVEKKQQTFDLFNSSDSEEKFPDNIQNPALKRKTVSVFDDTSNEQKPKKISLFDDEDEILPQKIEATEKDFFDNQRKQTEPQSTNLYNDVQTAKKISLFDDDDDFFRDDDLFSDISTNKLNSGLFDNLDLFSSNLHKKDSKEKETEKNDYNKAYDIEENVNQKPASRKKSAGQIIKNQAQGLNLFSDSSDEENKKSEDGEAEGTNTKLEKTENEIEVISQNEIVIPKESSLGSKNDGNKDKEIEEQTNKNIDTQTSTIEPEDQKESVNIDTSIEQKNAIEDVKKPALFRDSEDEVDDSLFSSIAKEIQQINAGTIKIEDPQVNVAQNIFERETIGAEKEANSKKMTTGLFEDLMPDDLFKTVSPATQKQDSSKSKTPEEQTSATHQLNSINQDTDPHQKVEINIFGSSPPPDDGDDWDVKSESLSDPDDYVPYHAQNNLERSSVFDNEPPSLISNESSGIVKTFSGSRVETDYSSFYPDASSSRRLSTDIFNEQQSQDSFFVTKTNSEPPILASNLNVIPEVSKSSILEITPSGNIKDFDTTTTGSSKDTLPSASTSKERDESLKFDNPRDIFLNKEKQSISEKIVSDKGETEVENSGFEKPVQTTMKIKIATITELLKNKPLGLPPQFRKSHSLDGEIVGSPEKVAKKDGVEVESVEVLHCITKDRARIPIKRRPSTRRGRQEAIRKSAADIDLQDDNKVQKDQPEKTEIFDKLADDKNIKATQSNLKETTSVEQLFVDLPDENFTSITIESNYPTPLVQEINPPNISDKTEVLVKKSTVETNDKSLFDDKLFSASKKTTAAKSKGSLFDSGDESDSDLFGDISNKKTNTEAVKKASNVEQKAAKVSKKALFEDNSSDDEFFFGSKGKQTSELGAVSIKTTKTAPVKKLQNIEADDDPLSTLLK